MQWSNAIRLYRYEEAPNEPGIYEIGFMRSEFFYEKYLGKATSIKDRLSKHYWLKGNNSIAEYLANVRVLQKAAQEGRLKGPIPRDNLYVRWSRVQDPEGQEARLLQKWDYEWNERIENV